MFWRGLLYIFVHCKSNRMVALNIIIAVVSCLLFLVLMTYQIYLNRRHADLVNLSTSCMPWCLLHLVIMTLWTFIAENNAIQLLYVNTLWGIFPLILLASSFLLQHQALIWSCVILGEVYNILHFCLARCDVVFAPIFYGLTVLMTVLLIVIFFVISLWIYIRRIRNVVQKTTVWTMLSFSVDVVYILGVIGVSFVFYISCFFTGPFVTVISVSSLILLLFTVLALSYRISTDSLFFFMRRHENVILESLNDVPSDLPNGRTSPEDMYKEIFERIIDHFERDMPFLSGNLVIDDLVKVVFANKLYISRAISRCAGRNFCQFVNYYRVKHSVETFRKNPELKVAELSSLCGFNSVGSFTMAFKLYMNENPSDWIRQERSRMIKYKP